MEDIQFFGPGIDQNIFTIDLHDSGNIFDALTKMERELYQVYQLRKKNCRVVHGIGEGKLAEAVHESLKKNPMIKDFECDGGSCLVLF